MNDNTWKDQFSRTSRKEMEETYCIPFSYAPLTAFPAAAPMAAEYLDMAGVPKTASRAATSDAGNPAAMTA